MNGSHFQRGTFYVDLWLTGDAPRVSGMLPLVELRLDSYIYKQQPTLSRSSYSHVDNDGVKALVDSICNRWCAMASGKSRAAQDQSFATSCLTDS